MSKEERPAEDGADEVPAKGGKKKLLLVALVAIVAAAGAGWFYLMPAAEAEVEEPHPGAVVPVEAIAVNFAGGGYLKIWGGAAADRGGDRRGSGRHRGYRPDHFPLLPS